MQRAEALPADVAGQSEILLLVLAPARRICRDLATGQNLTGALATWKAQAQAILALHRRDRTRVRVLDIAMALAHPATFRTRFGLPEGAGPVRTRHNDPDDPVLLVLAQSLLLSDDESRRMMSELEAISINFSNKAPAQVADSGSALEAYRALGALQSEVETLETRNRASQEALESLKERNAKLEAAQKTAELLKEQNTLMQAELERLAQLNETQETRVRETLVKIEMTQSAVDLLQEQNRLMQTELERMAHHQEFLEREAAELPVLRARSGEKDNNLRAAAEMLSRLETHRDSLLDEVARLTREGAAVHKQVETLTRDRDRLSQDHRAAREEAGRLSAELEHVYHSRSYRITSPLRRIRALFS